MVKKKIPWEPGWFAKWQTGKLGYFQESKSLVIAHLHWKETVWKFEDALPMYLKGTALYLFF